MGDTHLYQRAGWLLVGILRFSRKALTNFLSSGAFRPGASARLASEQPAPRGCRWGSFLNERVAGSNPAARFGARSSVVEHFTGFGPSGLVAPCLAAFPTRIQRSDSSVRWAAAGGDPSSTYERPATHSSSGVFTSIITIVRCAVRL